MTGAVESGPGETAYGSKGQDSKQAFQERVVWVLQSGQSFAALQRMQWHERMEDWEASRQPVRRLTRTD